MTSPRQLDPAQQRARFDTLASLEQMVSPLVHQGAVTAAMASLDSSLRFSDDGAVRFEIDGVAYDRPGDAVRAFFGQAWARPMLAPGASLPGFSRGSSHTPGDDPAAYARLRKLAGADK